MPKSIGPLTKKGTKKREKKERKQNKQRAMPRGVPRAIVEAVCSNYDPFCASAMGAKIHDSNTAPSLSYFSRSLFPVTTNAQGNALIWISANPLTNCNTATINAGGVVTAYTSSPNTFYSNIAAFPSIIQQSRLVSGGARFFTTQAWTSATGVLTIASISADYDDGILPNVATGTGSVATKSLALRDANAQTILRPRGMEALDYVEDPAADYGYTSAMYTITAATPSTTVAFIEMVDNYEWIPQFNTGYNLLATKAAPHLPVVMDARTHLATNADPTEIGVLGKFSSVMSDAEKSVKQVSGTIDTALSMYNSVSKYKPLLQAAGTMMML